MKKDMMKKRNSFGGNLFLKFLCAKVFALICVLTLSVGAMKATNYCRIRVVAVGVEDGTVYAGKWSGWSTSFPSNRRNLHGAYRRLLPTGEIVLRDQDGKEQKYHFKQVRYVI